MGAQIRVTRYCVAETRPQADTGVAGAGVQSTGYTGLGNTGLEDSGKIKL